MDEWEIQFKLQSVQRSEFFKFLVNPLKHPEVEFPSFPKDNFLRALEAHSSNQLYSLFQGTLNDLKFKNTADFVEDKDEIHVLMLVFEKIGPISLIFRQSFEYLILEGIDSNYNYLGHKAILNILVQVIKPDSPTVKGFGKITTVYYASNIQELAKKRDYVSALDTPEGLTLLFGLSILLPTIFIVILPPWVLDSMITYLISLIIISLFINIFPLFKRSTRYVPLSLVSFLSTFLIIELLIHFRILIYGKNPWGIFNNISRQNLIGLLQQQELLRDLSTEVFLGIEILGLIIPFLDFFFICLIPFTVGTGLTGLFQISERRRLSSTLFRSFFLALFLIAIILIPVIYHALGKGSEGTLFTSIGLIETAEMFSSKYIDNLEENYEELIQLIALAQEHLKKAGNSFQQFGENPLIAYILPYLIPNVAGIPLEDLPEILTLTNVLADSVEYYPNILWAYYNIQFGLNQSFRILSENMVNMNQGGLGTQVAIKYNNSMKDALLIMNLGVNNLTSIQSELIELISISQETLNYSIFSDVSNFLNEIKIGIPLLITAVNGTVPWINSTYKLTLVLDDLYQYNFDSNILREAKKDFNDSRVIQNIDQSKLPQEGLIPIRDLINFTVNLHQVTEYFLYATTNASLMFKSLNSTLADIKDIDFNDSTNIYDPMWEQIDLGLQNTTTYLNATQGSISQMSSIIASQEALEFIQLEELNRLIDELRVFTNSTADRFDVVRGYLVALNNTFQSVRYFSLGSNSLNQTLGAAIQNQTFDSTFNQSIENFTWSQRFANFTYANLSSIQGHFLNETAITKWQDLVKGNITENTTNSIYTNDQHCLDLIEDIKDAIAGGDTGLDLLLFQLDFIQILTDMEDLDDQWGIFIL